MMLKKIILLLIILIMMNYTCKDVYGAQMADYTEVYTKINDTDYLRKINLVLFILDNLCEHRCEVKNGTNIDFYKKMNLCMDKIYAVNNSTYTFNNKITYYFYRATFTSKYSEKEAIDYWKKYLYITLLAIEKAYNRNDIQLTLEVQGTDNAFKYLRKVNYNHSQLITDDDIINYIKNDMELKNDKDINNFDFEASARPKNEDGRL